jgi:hypothetical protein
MVETFDYSGDSALHLMAKFTDRSREVSVTIMLGGSEKPPDMIR